jgi:hypothetical protein
MHVTWMGWLLLALAPALVTLAPGTLYPLTVLLIPFSATAVANVDTPEGGSGVQPYIFVGVLWALTEILAMLRRGSMLVPKGRGYSIALLLTFALAALASLVMPVIIDGSLSILSPELLSPESTPLRFTWRHITQGLYLLFGITLTLLVAIKNVDPRWRMQTLKASAVAATFVSVWGWLQWFCYQLGVSYPAAIFNNSVTKSAVGYDRVIEDLGVLRVSSVAVEPSMLAQYLLTIFPLLLLSVAQRRTVWSPWFDKVALLLVSSTLLISTSASAYTGLGLALGLTVYALYRLGTLRARHLATIAASLVAAILAFTFSTSVRAWVSEILLTKAATYSGAERVSSVVKAWDYFTQYPLLGVGWGSVTSHDLVVKLLANTGVLGLFAFSLFASYLVVRLRLTGAGMAGSRADQFWRAGVLISIVTLLALSILTGFDYVFGHVWLVFGLAIAVSSGQTRLGDGPEEAPSPTRLSPAR